MRTLRRPMFRMGGSTNQGITSGLDKPKRGLVNEPGSYSVTEQMEELYKSADEIVRSRRPKETYKDRDDFLINLGLDLVSRPPSGNIISTIGESAKGPFKQFQTAQATKAKTQAESESDLFTTLVGAQAKVRGGEGSGKGWLKQWEFSQIAELNKTINELSNKENLTEEEKLRLQTAQDQKNQIVELDEVTKNFLKNNKYLVEDEISRLFTEDLQKPEDDRRYKTKTDLQLELDAMKNLRRRYGAAEGGRIGYQNAGSVMPAGMSAMPISSDMGQETGDMGQETMPEELQQNLTFEELRNRLPQEIGDDIINLILSSAEAMEDFATIQTEQDISNFNKKYGVNLVLPSEG